VITVHDLAIYDHPEWFPSPYVKSLGFSERIVVPYSVRQARRIIAVSNQTKSDLQRIFKVPDGKIDVIYEGAGVPRGRDSGEVAQRLGLTPKKYFLFLGTLEPRKNIPAAIWAFAAFVQDDPVGRRDLRFVIAGRKGWKYDPILEAIEHANRDLSAACGDQAPVERVNYLGYIKSEDKAAVLGQALAFVFPSHYEGFGLPVIEAMSLGVPVITSNRASLPEICGDACILVDPADQPAMTAAMRRLVEDAEYADGLSRLGRKQASRFDWDETAHQTLTAYERAVKEPPMPAVKDGSDDDDSEETTGFPLDRFIGL
jgi:glycosyltransferase involved in cell wall biosynthesis